MNWTPRRSVTSSNQDGDEAFGPGVDGVEVDVFGARWQADSHSRSRPSVRRRTKWGVPARGARGAGFGHVRRISHKRLRRSWGKAVTARKARPTSLHEPLLFEPEDQIARPGVHVLKRWLVLQPDAMRALLVDMQIKWHTVALQSGREFQGVLHLDGRILHRVPDKTWRGVGTDLKLVREQAD